MIHLFADAIQVTSLSSAFAALLHFAGLNKWQVLVLGGIASHLATWYKNRFLAGKTWNEVNLFHKIVSVISASPLAKTVAPLVKEAVEPVVAPVVTPVVPAPAPHVAVPTPEVTSPPKA